MSRSKRSPLSCSEKAIFRYFVSMSSNFMGRLSVLSGRQGLGGGNRIERHPSKQATIPLPRGTDEAFAPCFDKSDYMQIVGFSLVRVKAGKAKLFRVHERSRSCFAMCGYISFLVLSRETTGKSTYFLPHWRFIRLIYPLQNIF